MKSIGHIFLSCIVPILMATSPVTPEDDLDESLRRLQTGDYLGTRIIARRHLDSPDQDTAFRANYLTGVAWELSDQCSAALLSYSHARQHATQLSQHNDVWFRTGECHSVLDNARQARRAFRNVRHLDSDADKNKRRLVVAMLSLKRRSSVWSRHRLATALKHSGDEPAFYVAKAHVALAIDGVVRADSIEIRGRSYRIRRALKRRSGLVKKAEGHVVRTVELAEPEWILAGILTLAYASESAGDALLKAPIPNLTPNQRTEYESIIADRVIVMWSRAIAYLNEGTALAQKTSWQSPRVAQVRAARESLIDRIDKGPWSHTPAALGASARRGTTADQSPTRD